MRRLGIKTQEEERRPRGRPALFRDPVRFSIIMERDEYETIQEHAEAQGRSLNEELRRRLAETAPEAQPA